MNALGESDLDTFPLFNFFSFLGNKYVVGIVIVALILAVSVETFWTSGSTSTVVKVANVFVLCAMLLLLAFIVFVIYKVCIGSRFQFMPLTASASIILLMASLGVAARTALSDRAGFHVVQVLLAVVGSLVMGAIFSAFVKVAQRFISA